MSAEEVSAGFPLLGLLREAGIPTATGTLIVLGVIGAGKFLRRLDERRREDRDDGVSERKQLSTEQAEFRESLFQQNERLQKQMDNLQADLEESVRRHLDAERRVVEVQMSMARLAAWLISSGVQVPQTVLPDLSLPVAPRPPA